ncbi:MAG: hypothetical protein GY760_14135 [Deltaproteobacteria bacterium]|nr:hypothetical protein [Deltaproteobacteria bacterium]
MKFLKKMIKVFKTRKCNALWGNWVDPESTEPFKDGSDILAYNLSMEYPCVVHWNGSKFVSIDTLEAFEQIDFWQPIISPFDVFGVKKKVINRG